MWKSPENCVKTGLRNVKKPLERQNGVKKALWKARSHSLWKTWWKKWKTHFSGSGSAVFHKRPCQNFAVWKSGAPNFFSALSFVREEWGTHRTIPLFSPCFPSLLPVFFQVRSAGSLRKYAKWKRFSGVSQFSTFPTPPTTTTTIFYFFLFSFFSYQKPRSRIMTPAQKCISL